MANILKTLAALLVAGGSLFAKEATFSVTRMEKIHDFNQGLSDEQIKDLVQYSLNLDWNDGKYDTVGVTTHGDYFVVHLFEAEAYQSECVRLQKERDGHYSVMRNYDYVPENSDFCATCPDESIRILVSGSFSDANHVSRKYVKKAYDDLKKAGFKVKHLGGSEENRESVLNWLSCKNLVLWGRIGHGSQKSISFAGSYAAGSIVPKDLGSMNLKNKLLILNCCQLHNPNFIKPIIDQAGAKFYCGGHSQNLEMHKSEPVWHSIVMGGARDKKEFGGLVDAGNPKLGAKNKYGFTRHPSCKNGAYYAEIDGGDSPNPPTPDDPTPDDPTPQPPAPKPPTPKPPPQGNKVSITTHPSNQSANVGTDVSFTVAATGGKKPYRYAWYWNNTKTEETSAVFTFEVREEDRDATIHAVVTDASGSSAKSRAARLTVR